MALEPGACPKTLSLANPGPTVMEIDLPQRPHHRGRGTKPSPQAAERLLSSPRPAAPTDTQTSMAREACLAELRFALGDGRVRRKQQSSDHVGSFLSRSRAGDDAHSFIDLTRGQAALPEMSVGYHDVRAKCRNPRADDGSKRESPAIRLSGRGNSRCAENPRNGLHRARSVPKDRHGL